MRCLLVFGSLLVISVTYCLASPCECPTDRTPIFVTDEPVVQSPPDKVPAAVRTETISNVSRNSSLIKTSSKTKNSAKIKTKERKDGSIITIIIDKSKTKNKTRELTDSFDQTNRTINQGGVEESINLTKEKQQQLKKVSVAKKVTKEKIIKDKNGNIISNTIKSRTSEKDRKIEKTKESETLMHKMKKLATEEPDKCVTPPTAPCQMTTTTTQSPRLPCGCTRTTTTTEAPDTYPCGHPKPTE